MSVCASVWNIHIFERIEPGAKITEMHAASIMLASRRRRSKGHEGIYWYLLRVEEN